MNDGGRYSIQSPFVSNLPPAWSTLPPPITADTFAAEMGEFLKTSELTETKAFVGSFVKEIVVKPGRAAIVYSIPTPDDSPAGGADAVEIALNGRVMNSVRHGGPTRTELRTFRWEVQI